MKKMARIVSLATCAVIVLSVVVPHALAADADADKKKAEAMVQTLLNEERIKEQERKLSAKLFFASGEKLFKARQFEKAEQDFATAVALDPTHAKARKRLSAVRGFLGKGPAHEMLGTAQAMESVRRELERARMRKAIGDARTQLLQKDYDDAIANLRNAANIARVLATHIDVSRDTAEIESLTAKAQAAAEAQKARKAEESARQAKAIVDAEKLRVIRVQRQRVSRLLEDSKNLYQDTRYLDAARKCDEILKLEPRNKEVVAFKDTCVNAQIAVDIKRYEKDKLTETASTWRRTRKEAIPYTDWRPLYPDDWEEKRLRMAGTQIKVETVADAKWKKELRNKLERPVSFDFFGTPLEDVVAFLRQYHKVNIVIDTKVVGADRDLTLQLEKVKFKNALDWALRLLDLSYTLEKGAIFISTKEKIGLSQRAVTRFYDVTDLTLDIKNFKPDIKAISSSDLDPDDMDDIFSEDDGDGGGEVKGFTGDSLVEFIKSVIAPETWKELEDDDDMDLP